MSPEEIVARAINPDAWWNYENTFADSPDRDKIIEPSMRHARAALRALEEAGWKLYPPGQSSPRPRAMLDAARRG